MTGHHQLFTAEFAEALFSMVFRALTVLFSFGYNIETC